MIWGTFRRKSLNLQSENRRPEASQFDRTFTPQARLYRSDLRRRQW